MFDWASNKFCHLMTPYPSSKYGTILVLSNLTKQRSQDEKSYLGLQWGVRLQTSTDASATLARMTDVSTRRDTA